MNIKKFYRDHCPACDQADRLLKKAGMEYESINCESPEGEMWVERLNIRNLPVLLIEREDGTQKVLISVQEIKEWLSAGV